MTAKMARLAIATVLVAFLVAALPFLASQEPDKDIPEKATSGGNYSTLLRKIEVPGDKQIYGDFHEGGHWPAMPSYAGHRDLPAGHWVYVAPHWYIWQDSKKPRDMAAVASELMARNDPFGILTDKDVSIRIFANDTINGRIVENRLSHILVASKGRTRYWVNKAHVSYMWWDETEETQRK